MNKNIKTKNKKTFINIKFIEFNLHLGHKILNFSLQKQCDPLFSKLLLGSRFKISIIHNEVTKKSLLKSFYILALILRSNGNILIINTIPEFSKFFYFIKQSQQQKIFYNTKFLFSSFYNQTKQNFPNNLHTFSNYKLTPRLLNFKISNKNEINKKKNAFISYCNNKWIGGSLTNWKQIKKSVLTFAKFYNNFDHFVTINNIEFPRYKKMKKCFSGFFINDGKGTNIFLQQNPDIIFLINPNENSNIIKEANMLNIPIVALTDSNTKINGITFPIPANTKSINFVYWCLNWIIRFYNKI